MYIPLAAFGVMVKPCLKGRCTDFDGDCAEVKDHGECWEYDPDRGWCPFLDDEDRHES